ncbi:unnamed protein product [Prunus brigantina]
MDEDFAPMVELVKLRNEHGFLLVIDDVGPLELFRSENLLTFVLGLRARLQVAMSHNISIVGSEEEKALQSSQFCFPLYLFVSDLEIILQLHLTLFIINEQEFVEIRFPCDCN